MIIRYDITPQNGLLNIPRRKVKEIMIRISLIVSGLGIYLNDDSNYFFEEMS